MKKYGKKLDVKFEQITKMFEQIRIIFNLMQPLMENLDRRIGRLEYKEKEE